MKHKPLIPRKEKKEILWNVVNASLAGALVLLGAFTTGHMNFESFAAALIASGIVCVAKFKEYWDGEKGEYTYNLANFI
jgi:hypothetical protein